MTKKPNIILICCDQLRADALGAYGNKICETPHIDSLASEGTLFENAFTAVPSCVPARATLWTGLNQWHTGVLGMGVGQKGIPCDFPHTMAGELTADGYETRLVGKSHFSPLRTPMGFEKQELDESGRMMDQEDNYRKWFRENAPSFVTPDDHGVGWNAHLSRPWHTEEYLHPTAWTMTTALEALKTRDRTKPMFLNISFARPHSPYVPPKHYFDYYYNKELPEAVCGDWADVHDNPKDAKSTEAWRGNMTKEHIHKARAGYYGEVSFIDTQIGRLINWMKKYDGQEYKNTCFIFTSDHGDMLGDHNLWRKTYAYQGSAKIPMIVMLPHSFNQHVEGTVDNVVELRDIMPTVLNIAGTKIPSMDGEDLRPLIKGEPVSWRAYIHGEHCQCYSYEQEMHYVTDGKYKFIWLPKIGVEQFFDLTKDPSECRNLIDAQDYKDTISIWRNYLVDELAARDDGLTDNGRLVQQEKSYEPISPYRDKRYITD